MATDIFITPASGTVDFNNGVAGSVLGTIATMKVYDSLTTGNLSIQNATSGVRFLNRAVTGNIFEAYGTYGNMFTISDDLTDSIFSVNNSAGLPVLDIYSNNSVFAGQYGQNDFVITGNKIGIGTNNPLAKLHVTGANATSIIDGVRIGRGAGNIDSNVVVGNSAFISNTTGVRNIAIGGDSLSANTIGSDNSSIGFRSMYANTTGTNNVSFGSFTLYSNNSGYNNIAIGYNALYSNTFGAYNTAIGKDAMYSTTTGQRNLAVGYRALYLNTTGNYNTAIGVGALRGNAGGSYNLAVGFRSIYVNTTGNYNSAFGNYAVYNNSTGSRNSGFGYKSLYANTIGNDNISIGHFTATSNTVGNNNIGLGNYSLNSNVTGSDNIAIGYEAAYSNTNGASNNVFGNGALRGNTTGSQNSSFGTNSGRDVTGGNYNSFFGYNTGRGITTGSNNTIIGGRVGSLSASLSNNIIIADGAGNQRINIDSSGNTVLAGIVDATQFRDSANTTYYVDPAGTSNLVGLTVANTITGSISGNAATATTTDNINGRAFYNRDSGNALGQDAYTNNGIGYVNSVSLYGQTDGGIYTSAYSTSWIHQIYGDFRTGQIAIRGRNSGTWQSWRFVLDSSNISSYALPISGGTITGAISTNISGTSIFIGNQNVSTTNALRINWHTDADLNYFIGKRGGAWTQPMDIAFYTGIRYHANNAYNAHIFYVGGFDTTEAFSIGKGDNHVRVNNYLYAPLMYDTNDTAFYCNPGGNSIFNTIKTNNVYGGNASVTAASSTTINTAYNLTELTMSASITTLTLSNIQSSGTVHMWTIVTVGNGTAYSIAWPAAVKWPSGTGPNVTGTNTKRDIYQFVTYDGGTNIYAIIVGQNL